MGNLLTQEEFMNRAYRIQDSSISLEKARFVNTRTKVVIECNICNNSWDMLPKVLVKKPIKCPTCDRRDRTTSSYVDGAMTLYFIKIRTDMVTEPEFVYKVGITKYNVIHRFTPDDLRRIEILKEVAYESGKDCYDMEQYIHERMKPYKYYGKFRISSGNTELFVINPVEWLLEVTNGTI